jgi:2-amino-4-hydroxy-6-hydroxymethyldihydropteridine diphosphokinase
MADAYLGLGSNLGDRAANLHRALEALTGLGVEVTATSSIYRTAPREVLDQPEFFNQVVAVRTRLTPSGLLAVGMGIETRMGRRRDRPGGPRIIDLDLLLFGGLTLASADLTLPHPRMHLRRFVLVPLCEIAPELHHPVLRRTVRELLRELDSDEPPPVRVAPPGVVARPTPPVLARTGRGLIGAGGSAKIDRS